jgi:hypothetical protein
VQPYTSATGATAANGNGTMIEVVWAALAIGDTGAIYDAAGYELRGCQVIGTSGASVVAGIDASPNNPMSGASGDSAFVIAFSSLGAGIGSTYNNFPWLGHYIRPRFASGSGGPFTVTCWLRRLT